MTETKYLARAASFLVGKNIGAPEVAVVLGSGLSGFTRQFESSLSIPYHKVPGWPASKVHGHGGTLVVGEIAGVRVACLAGRVHLYEGWSPAEVVRAVRTLRLVGVPVFVLTNAAGGIKRGLKPGDLMVIRDHINLTGRSALLGPHEKTLGPRFPDQTAVYPLSLRSALHAADDDLDEGVYVGLTGPSYETPAEVHMVKGLGGDVVGMSTVLEATAIHAMGGRVAGLSLVTNLAAGISRKHLSHAEVVATGERAQARILRLLTEAVPALVVRE